MYIPVTCSAISLYNASYMHMFSEPTAWYVINNWCTLLGEKTFLVLSVFLRFLYFFVCSFDFLGFTYPH